MMKNFILVLISIGLLSCATGEKISNNIYPGMEKNEVLGIMGNPDGYKQIGEFEVYTYTNRLISGWSYDRTDYTFIYKENKLIEYGPGEVRERNDNGIHSVFIYRM